MPLIKLVVRPATPRARGECVDGQRPCPFVHCQYHLATKVLEGSRQLKVRFIPRDQDTCALDVADRGHHTLEEVGKLLGVTRERARQIEVGALLKLRGELAENEGSLAEALDAFFPEDRAGDEDAAILGDGA